jgi:hypothetical protein
MFARYASAVTTGTLMTFTLLYAMQGLIHLQPGAESEPRTRAIVDWINLPDPVATPARVSTFPSDRLPRLPATRARKESAIRMDP